MFHIVVVVWALLCMVYISGRIRSSLHARKSPTAAGFVASSRLHGQVASLIIAASLLALEAGHYFGNITDRTYMHLLVSGIIIASCAQIASAERARLHLRKAYSGEARHRVDPPTPFRVVEGGAGDRSGPERQEGPSREDRTGNS